LRTQTFTSRKVNHENIAPAEPHAAGSYTPNEKKLSALDATGERSFVADAGGGRAKSNVLRQPTPTVK
jgi:hypothetical protein